MGRTIFLVPSDALSHFLIPCDSCGYKGYLAGQLFSQIYRKSALSTPGPSSDEDKFSHFFGEDFPPDSIFTKKPLPS
jgi:hypothetical protein